jgi:hypothetical protein
LLDSLDSRASRDFDSTRIFSYWYRITLHKYGFDLNAETMAPLLKDFLPRWFLESLVDVFFFWFALRSYPGSVNIFWHRKERHRWSLSWSILFGLMILAKFLLLFLNFTFKNLIYLPSLILSVYVLGCIRCGVINSNLFSTQNKIPVQPNI